MRKKLNATSQKVVKEYQQEQRYIFCNALLEMLDRVPTSPDEKILSEVLGTNETLKVRLTQAVNSFYVATNQ